MKIQRESIEALAEYATHLKNLTPEDRYTRFCYNAKDEAIDSLILQILYRSEDHYLFTAGLDGQRIGFGHLAREGDNWELAVSVDKEHQGKGVADALMSHMIAWGRIHGINSVFMHCITHNTKIQHLARKHGLRTVERDGAEVTSQVELPAPTPLDYTADFLREQKDLLDQMADIQQRIWKNLNPMIYIKEHTIK